MQFSHKVLKIFFLSRLLVIFSALIGTIFVGESTLVQTWNVQVPFFNLFARWDSGQYIDIAKNGYLTDQNWAYRPLFPAILKASSIPLSPPLYIDIAITIVGFAVNAVLFLFALFFIHNLTKKLFSEKIADDTVLLVAFCPTSIFFSAVYSEPLLLLLFALSFLFLENGGMLKSGIAGYLAGLTRPEGIFASLAISAKVLLGINTARMKIIALISALVAFSSFFTALALAWVITGNPLIIFSVEFSWDHTTFIQAFNNPSVLLEIGFIQFYIFSLPLIAISLLTVFPFFIRNSKKIVRNPLFPYYVFAAFLIIFYLVVGDIRSLSRYFSILIPVYWTLALWIGKKPSFKTLIMLIFSILLVFGTILFVNWYHFI